MNNGHNPQWVFVRRVGDRVIVLVCEPQGPPGQIGAAVALMRKGHKGFNRQVSLNYYGGAAGEFVFAFMDNTYTGPCTASFKVGTVTGKFAIKDGCKAGIENAVSFGNIIAPTKTGVTKLTGTITHGKTKASSAVTILIAGT
jgi:hypothetical protein